MSIIARLTGIDDVRDRLLAMSAKARRKTMRRMVSEATKGWAVGLRQATPKLSGALKRSAKRRIKIRKGKAVADVKVGGRGARHAIFPEFGTIRQRAQRFAAKYFERNKGSALRVGRSVARSDLS